MRSSYKASSDVDYDNTSFSEFEVGNAFVEEACVFRMSLMIGALLEDVIVVFEESLVRVRVRVRFPWSRWLYGNVTLL